MEASPTSSNKRAADEDKLLSNKKASSAHSKELTPSSQIPTVPPPMQAARVETQPASTNPLPPALSGYTTKQINKLCDVIFKGKSKGVNNLQRKLIPTFKKCSADDILSLMNMVGVKEKREDDKCKVWHVRDDYLRFVTTRPKLRTNNFIQNAEGASDVDEDDSDDENEGDSDNDKVNADITVSDNNKININIKINNNKININIKNNIKNNDNNKNIDNGNDNDASQEVENFIYVYNIATEICQKRLCHNNIVCALTVLPEGRLISASNDIKVWEIGTESCVMTLRGHTNCVNSLLVLPDGRVCSGSSDKTIRIWNLLTKQCESVLNGHNKGINTLCLLNDGRLCSASVDATIRIWNLKVDNTCDMSFKAHSGTIYSLCSLPDGRVCSGGYDRKMKVWDLSQNVTVGTANTCDKSLSLESAVMWLFMMPTGQLCSGTDHGTIQLWNSSSLTCEHTISNSTSYLMNSLCLLLDGRLCSGYDDKSIKIWNKTSYECERTIASTMIAHNLCALSDELICNTVMPDEVVRYHDAVK